MKKIIIINLKKLGDIFQTGHLISSIKSKYPNSEVELLCYKEAQHAAKVLSGLTKIHTIDREKIISFYKNQIYSDGMAFNQIHNTLEDIINSRYDNILNYSNDRVSTFLTSYLSNRCESTHLGIKFSPKQSLKYSHDNAIILNDIITSTNYTPFTFNDALHLISSTENKTNISPIKTLSNHDIKAGENLNRLRSQKSDDPSSISIVGIQLCAGVESKEIPIHKQIEIIKLIHESKSMTPVILIAPIERERAMASEINSHFDNKIVSVEADFIALPSVLKNIELLISPDTSVKHLADLLKTPTIEVSLGSAPLFKQGTNNTLSAIISWPAHMRTFKESSLTEKELSLTQEELSAYHIYHTAQALLGIEETQVSNDISGFCTYQAQTFNDGTVHFPISGPYNNEFELRRLLSRALCQKIINNKVDHKFLAKVKGHFGKNALYSVTNSEKENLASLTKELLSTLRGLIQTQENKDKAPAFVNSLEKLLSKCYDNNLSSIPALIFRAKVESLNTTTLEENFKEVEGLLYQLKDDLQSCLQIYQNIESIEIDPSPLSRSNLGVQHER